MLLPSATYDGSRAFRDESGCKDTRGHRGSLQASESSRCRVMPCRLLFLSMLFLKIWLIRKLHLLLSLTLASKHTRRPR